MNIPSRLPSPLTLLLPLALGALAWATPLHAQVSPSTTSTQFALETRQGVDRAGRHALQEFTLFGQATWKPSEDLRVRAAGRLVSETKLDSQKARVFRLDEGYLQRKGADCDSKWGVQQVVWGQADRLRVVDQIHALDLRESVFGDPARSRLPLAMLNLECSVGDHGFQLLVIPQSRTSQRVGTGGRFATGDVLDSLTASVPMAPEASSPDWRSVKDWSSGLKWSTQVARADIALHALYGWQQDATAVPLPPGSLQAYQLRRDRLSMGGLTLSRPFGPFVVKAEASVVPKATAYTQASPSTVQPESVRDLRSLLGVDYQSGGWTYAAQWFDQQLGVGTASLAEPRQQIATLGLRREAQQGQLAFNAFVAHDLTRRSDYVKAEVWRQLDQATQLRLGLDHFTGDARSFGRFSAQSRVLVTLRYDLQ